MSMVYRYGGRAPMLFFVGLTVRLTLISVMAPAPVTDWYAPFMDVTTSRFTADPWALWLAGGGDSLAFPYGYAMWIAFLPLTILAKLVPFPLDLAYSATLLAADAALLVTLRHLFPERGHNLLVAYWLSPVVILATYGLGLNDLIPVLFLVWSILLIGRGRPQGAGVACLAAVSAKLSMIIALPFLAIYAHRGKALRGDLRAFGTSFSVAALFLAVPFVLSHGGRAMLIDNPEMNRIYGLVLHLGNNVSIYVVPGIYLVTLYLVWQIRRFNFDIFLATTGMAFLLVVLFTAGSPGWFIWCIPFLVYYEVTSGRVTAALIWSFSAGYGMSTLVVTPLRLSGGYVVDFRDSVLWTAGTWDQVGSLLHTAMVGIGAVLAIRIWRDVITRNDFFRLTRKPFVVGVAGDSGAGKDHLADALTGLVGQDFVARLSGDDYHLWDRHRPMWKAVTHLNPIANDIERFGKDLVSLVDGKSIQARHYDHRTGRMGRPTPVRSNDFIIAGGLHALYSPMLRECCDLTIYLDMDRGLRSWLKLRRDVRDRGHAVDGVVEAIAKREADSVRFIQPQLAYADLILSVQPACSGTPRSLDELLRPGGLKLVARTRRSFNELSLTGMLIGVGGLRVDMSVLDDGTETRVTVEGEVSGGDMELIAGRLCSYVPDFLDRRPAWQDGVTGLMQLIILCHIDQKLRQRVI